MWPNPQFLAELVTLTEEILNGKLHFLCIGDKGEGTDTLYNSYTVCWSFTKIVDL